MMPVGASIEALEGRICLSSSVATGMVPWLNARQVSGPPIGDTNDQISEAQAVSSLTNDQTVSGTLASATDVNLYAFSVSSNQRIAFDVNHPAGSTLDGYLRVFDATGKELASNDSGSAPSEGAGGVDPYLQVTFPSAGTYYVGISGSGNKAYNATDGTGDTSGNVGASGAYTLTLAGVGGSGFTGLTATATRTTDGSTSTVNIRRFNSAGQISTQAIDPTLRTWVLIHGYKGNPTTNGTVALAQTIAAKYPSDQVLTVDWSQAAADPTYSGAEQWLVPVASAVQKELNAHGINGQSVNFVGYSFGSTIAGEAAKGFSGGVNTILAIDPPIDAPGGYNPETSLNFAAVSNRAWAFHDDVPAGTDPTHVDDPITPTTADEAINVSGTNHGSIIALVNNLLRGNGGAGASQRFTLDRLLAGTPGPWQLNAFDAQGNQVPGGYEADLGTTSGGTIPTTLFYLDVNSGAPVTE